MTCEFWNEERQEFVRYHVKLTGSERLRLIWATIAWFLLGKTMAHWMGEDLEAVVCGWAPERYTELIRTGGRQ